MKLKFLYSLLFLATMFFSQANAQQTAKVSPKGTGFLQYLPEGYNSGTSKWPIVIALHGIKEKGTTSTVTSDIIASVAKVANVGLPKYVKYGAQYPFILISPQLKSNMGRWTGDYVMEVLNYVKTYLRVDPNRIYLTGLSLGGGGVWSVATAYPEVWASILPLCSGYNITSAACKLSAVDLPVWGFHGDADAVVSYMVTVNMINAINNCSPTPSPKAKLTILPGMGHVIWDKVYKETDALKWMLSYTKGSSTSTQEPVPTNAAPVANAGSDKSITLPTNTLSVTGSATDSDGTISSYSWTKKSGSTVTLSGTSTKTLALSNLVAGTYVFTLTVKDNDGATDTDDVTVVVKSATNSAPVANAGPNIQVLLPTTTATIKGSATDANNNISTYSWSKVSGGSVSMSGNTSATLSLSGLQSGTYTFRLTVKDTNGAVDTDDVLVVVDAPPTVSVGADKTVTLPLASLTLSVTASDADGTIASYNWYKVTGPVGLKLTNATSKTVTLSGLVEGTYIIKAVVKDNKGINSSDELKLIVKGSVAVIESATSGTTLLASL